MVFFKNLTMENNILRLKSDLFLILSLVHGNKIIVTYGSNDPILIQGLT